MPRRISAGSWSMPPRRALNGTLPAQPTIRLRIPTNALVRCLLMHVSCGDDQRRTPLPIAVVARGGGDRTGSRFGRATDLESSQRGGTRLKRNAMMKDTGCYQQDKDRIAEPGRLAGDEPVIPEWFDVSDPAVQDMLLALRFLCLLQRQPRRGERCPGSRTLARERQRSRAHRSPHMHTNVDFELDFINVSDGLRSDYERAVGSIGRAAMPGMHDPDLRFTAIDRISRVKEWTTAAARRLQFDAWRDPVLWCVGRCGADEKLTLEMMNVIAFADEVAGARLDFHELANAMCARCYSLATKRRDAIDPLA